MRALFTLFKFSIIGGMVIGLVHICPGKKTAFLRAFGDSVIGNPFGDWLELGLE